MEIQEAIKVLTSSLVEDDKYRESWKANIAMAFYDEFNDWSSYKGLGNKAPEYIHEIANNAADRFLDMLVIDSKHGNYED